MNRKRRSGTYKISLARHQLWTSPISPKGFTLEKFAALLAVAAPTTSLFSASIYFAALSETTKILPFNVFSLSDYFDKAIDLLLPAFLSIGALTLFVNYFSEHTYRYVVTIWPRRHRLLRSALVAMAALTLIVFIVLFPVEFRWTYYCLLACLLIVIFLNGSVALSEKIGGNERFGRRVFAATLVVFAFAPSFTILSADAATLFAKHRHFQTDRDVLIDQFSFGSLIIRDKKYVLIDATGKAIVEGNGIPDMSVSSACRWGWSWACGTSIVFEKQRA